MIFFTTRLEMERVFRDWCDESSEKIRASVPPSLNAMLAWLEENDYLNEEKIQKDFPYPGIKIKEHIRKSN